MTWRELKIFIANVPRDSATAHSILGPAADWTTTTHVVANLYDAIIAIHTPENEPRHEHPRPDLPEDPDNPDN